MIQNRVMAGGCFDCLHIGHVMHLQYARSLGDYLIVALTDDAYVNKGPGRPVFSWEERAAMLRSIRYVDAVVWTDTAMHALRSLRPEIYVKGSDWAGNLPEEEFVRSYGGRVVFTNTPKHSSTKILTGELLRERIGDPGRGV